MSELGTRLRDAREAAKVSLAAMAARTHYSKSLLALLETGRRRIHPEHVLAYARTLHVPVESLYDTPTDPLRMAHEWLVTDHPAQIHTRAWRNRSSSGSSPCACWMTPSAAETSSRSFPPSYASFGR
jgi:transcriptional regulator with XRE-family HTH domain